MGNLETWDASMALTSMGQGNPTGSQLSMGSQTGGNYSTPVGSGTDNLMDWSPTELQNPSLQQHQILAIQQQQQLSHKPGQSQTNNVTISQQWAPQAEKMGQEVMGMNGMDPNAISALAQT